MVNEYKPTEPDAPRFTPKEMVDCCDSESNWLNGEVVEVLPEGIKVHFSGYNRKFDEIVQNTPERILTQWRTGQPFKLNNRLDVCDPYGKWLEARVIEMNEKQIKVHYRNFHQKFDEWLPNRSDRIREVGTYSSAHGIGKIDPVHPSKLAARQLQPEIRAPELSENREFRFRQLLAQRGMMIETVESDGNCQFRAVSHQLYGRTQHHAEIRAAVIAYLEIERDYFAQFVIDGIEKFEDYLQHQAKNGAWGDDVELQAISEIYNRPIEVYAYANTPLRTFHETANGLEPLRVAYHGGSHYNSIVTERFVPLLNTAPGEWERRVLEEANRRAALRLALDAETALSREAFDQQSQRVLQDALQLSLQETDDPALCDVLQTSLLETTENQLMSQVMQESAQPAEDEQIRMALAMSMEEQQLHPAILQAIDMGFSVEQAMQAMSIVGDMPEAVIEYLLCSLK